MWKVHFLKLEGNVEEQSKRKAIQFHALVGSPWVGAHENRVVMSRRGASKAFTYTGSQVLISTATPAQNYVNLVPQLFTEEAEILRNTKCSTNTVT
jgi:hypothetical protein